METRLKGPFTQAFFQRFYFDFPTLMQLLPQGSSDATNNPSRFFSVCVLAKLRHFVFSDHFIYSHHFPVG